ncbi:MAG TPA: patatin-like phospholipase family protein [Acidimicrobiales bacterium]|jgi:NTE family protein|nr:patatin-like phospholipase family protein [Acidimicrobiales bacterium]
MKVIRGGTAPSIGLVLGAGGVVGQAYQAGVLAALEREIGWDPRLATVVVGTSAGSVTGAALRVGVPATDLAASLYGVPTSRRGGAILRRILPADSGPLPTPTVRSMLRPWELPSPALLVRLARRPLAFRPDVAAMTLVPRGQLDISERARGLDELMGDRWPEGLRICAVRRSDGARVVFGRPGAPPARLAPAVLASCAIPGYFRPVTIGGADYIDGGVHSVTNADVLRSDGLDLVVIVSSMSAAHGSANGADGLLRRTVHRRMEREIARLEQAGTAVISLEPGGESRRVMGLRAMAEDRAPRVIEAAYEETRLRALAAPFLASLGEPSPAASTG